MFTESLIGIDFIKQKNISLNLGCPNLVCLNMNQNATIERNISISSLLRISRPINLLLVAFTQLMTAYFLVETSQTGLPVLEDFKLYILILSTLIITAAGYMINDYYDVKSGVDFQGVSTGLYRPHPLLEGKLTPRKVLFEACGLYGLAIIIGLYLAATRGWHLFWIGLAGALASVTYTVVIRIFLIRIININTNIISIINLDGIYIFINDIN